MIKVNNLTFLDKRKQKILNNINLEIDNQDFICVLGENGSGKTTFFKILANLKKATSGEIIFSNNQKIGIIFQNPNNQLFSSIVANDIAFGLENINTPKNRFNEIIDNTLEILNIKHLKYRNVNTLSGGELQKVAVASILALDYDVIIFDEATSMLDPKNAYLLMNLMKDLNVLYKKTIIYITHEPHDIKFSNKIFYFKKGFPVEIFKTKDFLEKQHEINW